MVGSLMRFVDDMIVLLKKVNTDDGRGSSREDQTRVVVLGVWDEAGRVEEPGLGTKMSLGDPERRRGGAR